MKRFIKKRNWVLLSAILFVASAATAAIALGATQGSKSDHTSTTPPAVTSGPSSGQISDLGTPVDPSTLTAQDNAELAHMTVPGAREFTGTFLIGSADGSDFYRLANAEGPDCYAMGPASLAPGRFGEIGCVPDFPGTTPIVDLTIGQAYRVMGIASDAVHSIVLLNSAGSVVATAPVIGNVYSLPAESRPSVVALAALDASGNQLYSEPEYPPAIGG